MAWRMSISMGPSSSGAMLGRLPMRWNRDLRQRACDSPVAARPFPFARPRLCATQSGAAREGSQFKPMPQRWRVPFVAWPQRLRPSYWDGGALPLVIGTIILIAWASRQMNVPYQPGETLPISLDPSLLPQYG